MNPSHLLVKSFAIATVLVALLPTAAQADPAADASVIGGRCIIVEPIEVGGVVTPELRRCVPFP